MGKLTPEQLLKKHGICPECGDLYSHDITAPFAHCKCGTSEWYAYTPHMLTQHKLHLAEDKIAQLEHQLGQVD